MVDFQQPYLNEIKNKKIKVRVLFSRGDNLIGTIIAFDSYAIVLRDEEKDYLIFKNNINFIEPLEHFKFNES